MRAPSVPIAQKWREIEINCDGQIQGRRSDLGWRGPPTTTRAYGDEECEDDAVDFWEAMDSGAFRLF